MIAILITTFLKDEALDSCVRSILSNRPKQDFIILIADQNPNRDKGLRYSSTSYPFTYYYDLPYDCGLSYSRNFLVKKAKEFNCNYCLLMADNIQFTSSYDFQPIINFLNSDIDNGVVGFYIDYHWHYKMEIKDGEFVFSKINESINFKGIIYNRYDIIPNFWLGKIEAILQNPWDEKLKMTEHEDWMMRLKLNTNYRAYSTNIITAKRIVDRTGQYQKMRQRHLTDEFRNIVRQKYNLNPNKWIRIDG